MTAKVVPLENSALRLVRYLKEFVGLGRTTVYDVAKYDSVLWFKDMPQEADCRSGAWTDDYDADDPWLEVKKQQFEKMPSPPSSTLPWVDEKALKRATLEIPALLPTIFLPDDEAEIEEGETPPLIEHSLDDHAEVQEAYDRYRPRWEAWSMEYRRRASIQRIYAELFRLHTQVRKQGEIIEVVLGATPLKEAIQTLHQAILCGLVVKGDVFHVAAHQNESPRPARSRPSNRQRFSRPDHGIRLLVFYLTDTQHGMRHVPCY